MHGRETVGKMEKFSVKKPFTVLVAVVMVLILGFVAITKMQTNLLPDVSTPYLMVVTVYPGASPERVESEVSDVLQNALTVPGVENITATSAENYSLLLMHFTDDTDMNSALVKVSNKLDQAKSDLPSSCLTPSIIEYSLNMNAFMTVAVSREGSDIYQLSELVKDTLVPYVQRKGGVSNVSSSGLVEKLVQVQLNQDKIDEINAQLLDLIDTKLADARAQLDSAESQIAAGRAEYNKQMKNFGNTVSNTVLASMSTEVGNAVDVVRKQARALMESVNQLIAVVKEPEIQQALIEVQQGLQKVLDKFDNTGMRDIDSLIEVVSELRDVTDKLTDALQKLQERVNTETGTEGSSAADLADELQLQKSLQVIYSTLEDTIKAMDNVPQLMSTFSRALGSFTQQQLNAYMQFTEAREQLNEYEKQLESGQAGVRDGQHPGAGAGGCAEAAGYQHPVHADLRPELLHAGRLCAGQGRRVVAAEGRRGVRQRGGHCRCPAAACGRLRRRAPVRCCGRRGHRQHRRQLHPPERPAGRVLKILQELQLQCQRRFGQLPVGIQGAGSPV